MLSKIKITGLLAGALALMSPAANAVWEGDIVEDPEGNYYRAYIYECFEDEDTEEETCDDKSWELANIAAGETFYSPEPGVILQGHLATITSPEEDQFLFANRSLLAPGINTAGFFDSELWVGGSQPMGLPTGEGWTWVNGEGRIPGDNNDDGGLYANWGFGEPNDSGGGESYLAIWLGGDFVWNDEAALGGVYGYLVEYDRAAPLDTCVDDGSDQPAFCNPAGVQENTFPPEGVVLNVPPGEATYTQTILENTDPANGPIGVKIRDPRVNDAGECHIRRRLDVFDEFPSLGATLGGQPGDLILSRFECGSPFFAVLKSDAVGFTVQNGVIRARQLPEEIFEEDEIFACDGVYPNGVPVGEEAAYADLQRRGVAVWQPDDRNNVLERRALALTTGCGSRLILVKRPSFFVLNTHTDCGLPFGMYPNLVRQCFRGLTLGKFERLKQSLRQARLAGLISRSEFRGLNRTARRAELKFIAANYDGAIADVLSFTDLVEAADIAPTPNNDEGDLLMRAGNLEFEIAKIRDDAAPPD